MTSPEPTARIEFEVDPSICRLTALKKAAYRCSDRYRVHLQPQPDGRVRVELMAKESRERGTHPGPDSLSDAARLDFCGEALDQELREMVAEETLGVRNLLLAQAFSATSLLDPEGETGDPDADPLGIRVSQATDRGHAPTPGA